MNDRLVCPECKFPTLESEKKCRVCGYAFTGSELAGEQHDWKKQLESSDLSPFLEQLRAQGEPAAKAEPTAMHTEPAPPVIPEPVEPKPQEIKRVREQPARKTTPSTWPDNAFTASRPVRFCSRCGGVVSQNTNFCTKCNTYCAPKPAYKEVKKDDDKCDDSHVFGSKEKKNTAGCAVGGIIIGIFVFIVIVMIITSSL